MEGLKDYILSVVAAALVVSVLKSVVGEKGTLCAMMALLCGLFLTLVVLTPVVKMDFSDVLEYFEEFSLDARDVSVTGQGMAEEEYRAIIKQRTETYILDKADELGLNLNVEVTLSDDDTAAPVEAKLWGEASPGAKSQLQRILWEDLVIPKENQRWIWKR